MRLKGVDVKPHARTEHNRILRDNAKATTEDIQGYGGYVHPIDGDGPSTKLLDAEERDHETGLAATSATCYAHLEESSEDSMMMSGEYGLCSML